MSLKKDRNVCQKYSVVNCQQVTHWKKKTENEKKMSSVKLTDRTAMKKNNNIENSLININELISVYKTVFMKYPE